MSDGLGYLKIEIDKSDNMSEIETENINDMVEHGIGFKLLIGAGKSLLALIFVLVLEPVYDWIVLQVDSVALLSSDTKAWLGDFKLILLVITAFFVAVKVIVSTIKVIIEFKAKK